MNENWWKLVSFIIFCHAHYIYIYKCKMDSSVELLYFLLSYFFPKQLSDPDLLNKMLTIGKLIWNFKCKNKNLSRDN